MADLTTPTSPSPFSSILPRLQVAWDSTSLGLLLECPRKYFYQMIMGFQPKGTSIHLSFGIAYHKAMEIYHHALAAGADFEEALQLGTMFCLTFDEGRDRDSYKNKLTLTRSFIWHCEKYHNDPCQTVILANGKPAVEYSFRFALPVDSPEGDPFLYCGHLDRLVIYNGSPFFLDYKTTKSQLTDYYFDGFSPNTQFSGYNVATQVVLGEPAKGGIVDAAQLQVNGSRFERRTVRRTNGQVEEWFDNTAFYLRQAQRYAEEDFYPMNEKSCGNYGGCAFRSICSKDPSVRDPFLKGDFERWEWNPLEIRGDL